MNGIFIVNVQQPNINYITIIDYHVAKVPNELHFLLLIIIWTLYDTKSILYGLYSV